MKIIICPDSFKGSLSSIEAADAIEQGVLSATSDAEIVKIPLADGGEGTVEALVQATGGQMRKIEVCDPLMRPIEARFGLLDDGKTAVIEMASASGLPLLSENERNPLTTSTYGTGQLMLAAAELGVEKIILGIGGSATNDGGAGAMSALGAVFVNKNGDPLPPGGAALADLDRIDMSGFEFPVDRVKVEAACDVSNPLCGPEGASKVFGPQKGATPNMVRLLDDALANYARVIAKDLGQRVADMPGAGAAGGLGAGLAAFLNAELRSGIDMVLDAVHFNDKIISADLVITGEGRIDDQTAFGKTIAGVLKRTSPLGIAVVAIGGAVEGNINALYDMGLTAAFSITNGPMTLDDAIMSAAGLVCLTSENIVRLRMRG